MFPKSIHQVHQLLIFMKYIKNSDILLNMIKITSMVIYFKI